MPTILEQKFTEMISTYRRQLASHSDDIQRFASSAESMQSPCQIHILSCKEYDLNLIIKTVISRYLTGQRIHRSHFH